MESQHVSPLPMTASGDAIGLLVSVRSLEEAKECLAHRIAILDWKEPENGALGAVPNDELQAFFDWKKATQISPPVQQGRFDKVRFSFAAGELFEQKVTRLVDSFAAQLLAEFSFIKVGLALASPDWPQRWARFFEALPLSVSPVMVIYADAELARSPSITDCLKAAIQHPQCHTVLLDTFSKSHGLFDWVTPAQLAEIRVALSEASMTFVCAGSLGLDSLDRVIPVAPDYIGVRGAVCEGNRRGTLSGAKVKVLLDSLAQQAGG